ncbi:3-hydroxyacyl-CoA dehydrogenase NAD-binding domain-containing protein [Aliiroseovarius sp. PTFE2010]|uniref:3-hydroxyacyl-CoA dehydrogenase NAD-binding domain-containing protein n=1 Tax=Aliiroseovarius sp. PTFE2010 TaxID=3417190 RepID=UPI003CEAD7FC
MRDRLQPTLADGVATVALPGRADAITPLDGALRAALWAALDRLRGAADVRVVVLMSGPGGWPGGLAIDGDAPGLADLCALIEEFPIPVIAALQGQVLGSGLDLALACHHRVSQRGTRFAARQITLGVPPWGGATQRLPRIVGAGAALDVLLSGQAIGTARGEKIGLVDTVSRTDLSEVTAGVARELAGSAPTRARDAEALLDEGPDALAAIAERRAGLKATRLHAPGLIVDCVEAAMLLPFEGGMDFERAAFDDAVAGEQSQALHHLAACEPLAARPPTALPKAAPPRKVAIIGASGLGQGLAIACLNAGIDVALIEAQEPLRDKALARIRRVFAQAHGRGQITAQDAQGSLDRLALGPGLSLAEGADLGIEAVAETEPAKVNVLSALQSAMAEGATLVTKTVYLDMPAIAAALPDPSRLVGMRFHAPAHLMRMVEISILPQCAPDAAARAMALVRALNKQAVQCAGKPGLICERLKEALHGAAHVCVEEGASPADVDIALQRFGFSRGVFQGIDALGVDTVLAQRQAYAPKARGLAMAQVLVDGGQTGRGVAAGWLAASAQKGPPADNAQTLDILQAYRAGQDIEPRPLGRGEIQRRCLAAMVNEGARMMETGAVPGVASVDVGAVFGLGFPAWKGGPMKAADQWGLLQLENALRSLQDNAPDLYTPAPMIRELIKNGQRFSHQVG